MLDFVLGHIRIFGPDKGCRVLIILGQVLVERCNEGLRTWECAASDVLPRDLAEPSLDQLEPGTAARNVVKVEPGVTLEPTSHRRRFMRAIVFGDQVQIQLLFGLSIDLVENLRNFLFAVAR